MKLARGLWFLLFVCLECVSIGCSVAVIGQPGLLAPLLDLVVRDEDTGEVVLDAAIVATDGIYTTHLLLSDDCYQGEAMYTGVYRAGTYDVTIVADGYVPYGLEGVILDEADNVVEPVEVFLSRQPPE